MNSAKRAVYAALSLIVVVILVGGAFLFAYVSATHKTANKIEALTTAADCRWRSLVLIVVAAEGHDNPGIQRGIVALKACG